MVVLWRGPGLRAESPEFAQFFETDTDCLFGVSARRPGAGFDYISTRPQPLSLSLSLFILVVLVIIAESNPFFTLRNRWRVLKALPILKRSRLIGLGRGT
jgi:hypothetical protein